MIILLNNKVHSRKLDPTTKISQPMGRTNRYTWCVASCIGMLRMRYIFQFMARLLVKSGKPQNWGDLFSYRPTCSFSYVTVVVGCTIRLCCLKCPRSTHRETGLNPNWRSCIELEYGANNHFHPPTILIFSRAPDAPGFRL